MVGQQNGKLFRPHGEKTVDLEAGDGFDLSLFFFWIIFRVLTGDGDDSGKGMHGVKLTDR